MKKNTIQYNGKELELKFNTGVHFRFERAGYTFADFDDPARRVGAHVAFIGAAVDPAASLDEVADRCPGMDEMGAAIAQALGIEGEAEDDTELGKECEAGENSEPSPVSNSGSKRKSLKKSPQAS